MTPGADREASYLGIDLGTSKITICTDHGTTFRAHSAIVRNADPEFENEGDVQVYSGEDAFERTDLDIKWPVRDLMDYDEGAQDLKALIERCLMDAGVTAEPQNMYAIITVPSNADSSYRRTVLGAARPFFKGVMVANDLFCAAYGSKKLEGFMIINMGASKTELCRIQEGVPEDGDYLTMPIAGENIDQELVDLLAEKYESSKVTKELARIWKETYGFVGNTDEECSVELPMDDSAQEVVITEELRLACESIIPDVVSGIVKMVSGARPQFREALRNNICLCGGGSKMRNMVRFIENELSEVGGGRVFLLDSPESAGAYGACRLAEKMPGEFWEKLSNCKI